MNTQQEDFGVGRGADLVQAFLAALDDLSGEVRVDPAHAERLSPIEEAARLVADAAAESPRSLRAAALADFRAIVLRLAMEADAPAAQAGLFAGDEQMEGLEREHGSVAAALLGLESSLAALEAGLRGPRGRTEEREARGMAGLVRLRRSEVAAWAREADRGLSAVERSVLRAEAGPALRRDAWTLCCLISLAVAHASDYACVEARVVLDRLAEAGAVLAQSLALLASLSAVGARAAEDEMRAALMALLPVVGEGMRIMRSALARRDAEADVVGWRLLSRGRTGIGAAQVDGMVRGLSRASAGMATAHALARAAAEYEAEWR